MQRLIECRPAKGGIGLHDVVKEPPFGLAMRDRFAHPQVRAHNLIDQRPTASELRHQALAHDPAQRFGKAHP
jgi:hypothetical protein